jgi:hypothetical protein
MRKNSNNKSTMNTRNNTTTTSFKRHTIERNIEKYGPKSYRVRGSFNGQFYSICGVTSLTRARQYRKQILSGTFTNNG